MYATPENTEGRQFLPVTLGGGLDQVTSKFTVYPGSLQDVLNYESTDTGYGRSQGLLFFDGTYDSAIEDMWYVGAQLSPRADATMVDVDLAFTIGSRATWGTDSSGVVVYWKYNAGASDSVELGLVEVQGTAPAAGDTITDSVSGAEIVLSPSMLYPPTTLATATHPDTDVLIADTIAKYLNYMNTEVNASVAGQEYQPGSLHFHGKVPGVNGITGGFQYKDSVYAVRDHYAVGFDSGDTEILIDSDVVVVMSANVYRGTVARTVLADGEWTDGDAEGSIIFKPRTALATAWADSTAYALYDMVSHDGVDYVCTSAHTSALADDEPGEGTTWETKWDVNDIKTLTAAANLEQIVNTSNDQLALVNTANVQYKGALWQATVNGWAAVDTGYTLEYDTGTTAPTVATTPLFLADITDVAKTAGDLAVSAASTQGSVPLAAWTNESNILADDATYATCTISPGGKSEYLVGTVDTTAVPDNTVKVLGVEVTINAKHTGSAAVKDWVVQLVDNSTGQYLSANRAQKVDTTASDVDYVRGGANELWGFSESIDPQTILDGNLSVRVQYYNDDGSSQTVAVDYISVNVRYAPPREHVYVEYTPGSDAEMDITAFQILDGMFSSNTAAGPMTVYNITDIDALAAGMVITTGAGGTGDTIATITAPPVYNLLPSSTEMAAHSSKYESIVANFREAADATGVYGVTGASPAFMMEGVYFSFIRTPQWIVHDKPRHVAFHVNHLALGFDGSVIFSAVGVPNDFSGGSGTQYPTGGRVTGLAPLPGDAVLGVWTDRRTMTLVGRDPTTDVSLQVISDSSGAIEYTVQDIGTPYFADFRGLSTVETTDRFGDFDLGRISFKVTPFLKDRLQERRSIDTIPKKPIASLTARNKNQYRLYFEDGYILTMTFFETKAPEFTVQHYDTANLGTDYVPTFTSSYVLSNGRERNIMGTSDGSMWVVDGANGIQDSTGLTELDCYMTLNPTNLKRPEGVNKFYHVVVQGQFFGHQEIEAWSDTNYVFSQTGAAHDTIQVGDSTDAPVFTSSNNLDSVYISQLADGYSVKLQTSMNGSKPHTLQSLLFRASGKGTDRTSTTRNY